MRFSAALIVALLIAAGTAHAAIHRSTAAKNAFKRLEPCPASGLARGPCPGWVVDHIWPLCAGGADAPGNMQWQDRPESLIKDRFERHICRR